MSTPNPPYSKLDGLDLYAPRRARARPLPNEQEQSANEQEQLGNEQERSWASDQEQYPAGDQDTPPLTPNNAPEDDQWPENDQWQADEKSAEAVQARIDDAVRAMFEPEQALREAPAAPLPRAPRAMQRHGRAVDRTAWLRSRLDPEVVPAPAMQSRGRFVPLLGRFSLVVGIAAVVAYGLTVMTSRLPDPLSPKPSGDPVIATAPLSPEAPPEPQSPTRLVVENQQAFVNEPLTLGVSVAPSRDDGSLLVAGLAAGTRLSAGTPVNDSSWRLPSHNLDGLYLYAPKDFVGAMNTAIDLLSPSQKLLDRRAVRLEWIVKKDPPSPQIDKNDSGSPAVQAIDPQQAAVLLKRGKDVLASGDIAAARLVFRRLADAGLAEAALRLAATYDPRYLTTQNVIGVAGDEAQARAWYQRATELGSTEAKEMLARMATK